MGGEAQSIKMKGKGNTDSDFGTEYNKRKKALLQKMEEITTLCGVQASLVIYNDMEEGGGPVTWPANARQVRGMANELKKRIELGMSGPKADDVDSLTGARLDKEKLKLAKLLLRSGDKETRILMSDCLAGKGLMGLSMVELNELSRLIVQNLNRMSDLNVEEAGAGMNAGREVLDGNGGQDQAESEGPGRDVQRGSGRS